MKNRNSLVIPTFIAVVALTTVFIALVLAGCGLYRPIQILESDDLQWFNMSSDGQTISRGFTIDQIDKHGHHVGHVLGRIAGARMIMTGAFDAVE